MRGVGIIGVFMICCIFFTTIAVASPPSHKNFLETESDYFSLLSYFLDTKILCEQISNSSYQAQITVTISDTIEATYDDASLNTSLQLCTFLMKKTSYPTILADTSLAQIESYHILSEVSGPLKQMASHTKNLAFAHAHLINTFNNILEIITTTNQHTKQIYTNLTHAHHNLSLMRQSILEIEKTLPLISSYMTMYSLHHQMKNFSLLLTQYEHILDQLINQLETRTPVLVLHTNKQSYEVGETIMFSGYFIAPNGYVPHQEISIYFPETTPLITTTNQFGRFTEFFVISNWSQPGKYVITTKTTYHNITYSSEPVEITISLIPTTLFLQISKTQITPKQPIQISGRLTTKDQIPIQDSIQLIIESNHYEMFTNNSGWFTTVLSNYSTYGAYHGHAYYDPSFIYQPSTSEPFIFEVNEPTILTIQSDRYNISKGDYIRISGRLESFENGETLPIQPLSLSINGMQTQYTHTDEQGTYSFLFHTENITTTKITIQTTYESPLLKWRDARSPVITISMNQEFLSILYSTIFPSTSDTSTIPMVLLLSLSAIIGVFFCYLFLTRKIHIHFRKNKEQSFSHQLKKSFHLPLSSYPILSSSSFFSTSKKPFPSISLKQRITRTYRTLIRYLSHRGMDLQSTLTHRDIQKRLHATKLPKDAIDEVTVQFELARYSSHQQNHTHAITFDQQVFSIITSYKE